MKGEGYVPSIVELNKSVFVGSVVIEADNGLQVGVLLILCYGNIVVRVCYKDGFVHLEVDAVRHCHLLVELVFTSSEVNSRLLGSSQIIKTTPPLF